MNISTITNIKYIGSWQGSHGTMHTQQIAFEDGTMGEANSKEATPPYKVGDQVGYEVTGTTPKGTKKVKIDRKPQMMGSPAPQASAPAAAAPKASQDGPILGMCFKLAVDSLKGDLNEVEIIKRTQKLKSIYANLASAKTLPTEDAPF